MLVRYCGRHKIRRDCLVDKDYLHPENAYLVKYFPKYYKGLALVIKPQHSLLSKIKRIKKLKGFTGNFNRQIPQVEWFKILANSRKEVEEFPQIDFQQTSRFSWAKATLKTMKFFFQMTKLQIPTEKSGLFGHEKFLFIWKPFSKHLRNMRRLKTLKINASVYDSDILRSFLNKLKGMPKLLAKFGVLESPLFFAAIQPEISSICKDVPQIAQNLKSLSLEAVENESIRTGLLNCPKFLDFVTPIQRLSKLQSISLHCSVLCSSDSWPNFIPPASLRNLTLRFNALNMIGAVFELSNPQNAYLSTAVKCENFFDHWKEINELDALRLEVRCENAEEILFTKDFITAMLKKVSRLSSFTCCLDLNHQYAWRYEPFEIEKVPHLYEHLKKLKVRFSLDEGQGHVGFDFAFLKPFKNLKEIGFQGYHCCWANLGDAIRLLEGSTKSGGFPTLKLGEVTIYYPEELKDLLKKISKAKTSGTNLKIRLALEFLIEAGKDDDIKYLDQFCEIIESKPVKGLEILLNIENQECSRSLVDEVKRVLGKYSGIRNFMLRIFDGQNTLEYIKRDGEKEQLLFDEIVV